MNFTTIFKMQKELDNAIKIKSNIDNNVEIRKKRILALIVELAEFANEVQVFKYWKQSKTINQKHVLEEYIDCIHFLSSLALDLGLNPEIEEIIISNDLVEQMIKTFDAFAKLESNFSKEELEKSFGIFLGIAKLMNFSDKEINDSYIEKNKINFERIASNY